MAVKFSNNGKTTLASNITSSATSISVTDGSVFPTLSGGDTFFMTLEDISGNIEIVSVTARSGNTLTVTRAQEGTTARAFSSSDKAENRLTAAGLNSFVSDSGDTMTGNLSFGDNNKAIFGASNDLEILHDGTNSVIRDNGSGNLSLTTNGAKIGFYDQANNQFLAEAFTGAGFRLYYDGSQKFVTQPNGIDVTGTVTADGLTISAQDRIYLDGGSNTYIQESAADDLRFFVGGSQAVRVRPSGTTILGTVTADGLTVDTDTLHVDSTNNRVGIGTTSPSSKVEIYDTQNTQLRVNTASHGYLDLSNYANGAGVMTSAAHPLRLGTANTERMRITSTGLVGIGTSSPAGALHIVNSGLATQLRVSNTTADATTKYGTVLGSHYTNSEEPITGMLLTSSSSATGGSVSIGGGISSANAVNTIKFYTAANNTTLTGTERMRISSAGDVLISTTTNIVANSSTSSGTSIGSGLLESARAGVVAQFNRQNSDGSVIDIQRSGTTVGSIGTAIGNAYFAGSSTGITFGSANVYPTNASGTKSSGTLTLGSASNRFDDLYLGGTANAVTINTDGPTGTGNGIVMAASGWPYKGRIGMNGTSGGKQYWTANYNLNTSSVDSASYYSTYIENSAQNGIIAFGTSSAVNTAPSERLRINSTGVDVTGALTISGDLTVNGTTTTINSTTLTVDDKNIVLASGAADAAAANGSGITIDGADATFTYVSTGDKWQLNKPLDVGGNVTFGDNEKAIFGAGSDLQIYHDGSHSYIHEVGTGDLRLKVNDLTVQSTNGTYMMRGVTNGAVSLYYSNFPKLDTSNTGISVSGDITVSGNVDGRDVATDGTKLDGIEAGATADQTAAQILTAIKTVDGSGSGLDADLLDGLDSTAFARADQTAAIKSFNSTLTINSYTRIARITGGSLSTAVRAYFSGTANNIVVNAFADILVNHSGDIQISSNSSDYTPLTLKVEVNGNNEDYDLYAKHTSGATTLTLSTTIHSIGLETITPNPTATAYSGGTSAEHTMIQGGLRYSQSSNNVDIYSDGDYYSGSSKVWHAGNDGAGSGLDADTVDGIQASSFLRSDADDSTTGGLRVISGSIASTDTSKGLLFDAQYTNGQYRTRFRKQDKGGGVPLYIDASSSTANSYTELARFGSYSGNGYEFEVFGDINATGNLYDGGNAVWHAGNDGSGSGLDADTVDGYQAEGSSGNRWGIIPAVNTQGVMEVGRYIDFHASDGSTEDYRVRLDGGTSGQLYLSGNAIWHAGNDGSGSGLDADLLDGIDSLSFKRNDQTGVTAEFSKWYSTSSHVYSNSVSTYYWIHLGTMGGASKGSIEYEFKTDENYPHFVKGTIAFSSFSGGTSFGVQHDQHSPDRFAVQVRLDTSRRIWIRAAGVAWAHFFRFRTHHATGTFTTNTSFSVGTGKLTSVPANSSSDINGGHNLRATNTSVTGSVPTYTDNYHRFPNLAVHNNVTINGNTAWHAGNDGSGSGLDADLLDGVQGSSFLRSDADDTMTGQLTISGTSPQMKFNDTDADDFWIHINSNNFYILTDRDDNGSWDGTYPLQLTNSNSTISSYGNTVWTSGNDGSGSGLDADTVDGLQASSFVRSDADDTMTGNLDINKGASTTLSVRGSGTGTAKIWARGASQATAMVMVSQDDSHGGGIEYNGDNNPVSTGAGADYIALFRVASGTYSWTARNAYSNNDWQFRGNVTAYASDERLKENIETIPNALDKVCKLRGVTFDWKDDCEDKGFMPTMQHETGVIAQEVQAVIPDAAVPAPFDEEYLTVKHEKIIPVLIEAIKELKAEVDDLKTQIAEKG